MPVEQKGLAFKYFDKAICAVAALGLLLVVVLALGRGRKGADEFADEIDKQRSKVAKLAKKPPKETEPKPFESLLEVVDESLAVVGVVGRQIDAVERVHIEPFLRGVDRHVGKMKANC